MNLRTTTAPGIVRKSWGVGDLGNHWMQMLVTRPPSKVKVFLAMCPEPLQAWAQENQDDLFRVIPSKSTISRSRLAFDSSWTLWWRAHIRNVLVSGAPAFALFADSSPMLGRDWFVMQYEHFDVAKFPGSM